MGRTIGWQKGRWPRGQSRGRINRRQRRGRTSIRSGDLGFCVLWSVCVGWWDRGAPQSDACKSDTGRNAHLANGTKQQWDRNARGSTTRTQRQTQRCPGKKVFGREACARDRRTGPPGRRRRRPCGRPNLTHAPFRVSRPPPTLVLVRWLNKRLASGSRTSSSLPWDDLFLLFVSRPSMAIRILGPPFSPLPKGSANVGSGALPGLGGAGAKFAVEFSSPFSRRETGHAWVSMLVQASSHCLAQGVSGRSSTRRRAGEAKPETPRSFGGSQAS